jgi:hypothetical protein
MGPPGLDGEDGINGENGEVACLVCHSGDNIAAIKAQFASSSHYAGLVNYERVIEEIEAGANTWSASCAQCHSSEGFISWAVTGSSITMNNPGKWECATCHGVHETFEATDYALRKADAAAFIIDATAIPDLGNSNLCKNCHQNRSAEPNVAKPGDPTFNVTVRLGPHHGPQANILYGIGFAEIAGTYNYPADGSSVHMDANARCTGCHMSTYGNGKGGHTWVPGVDACNSCHSGSDLTTNYNYNNVQTNTQALLDELKTLLVAEGTLTAEGTPVVNSACPMVLARAAFNYIGITEDRSLGVHNPTYVEALLNNSIEAVEAYQATK